MTRISMLTTNLARGGAETQVAALSRALAARGWQVSVISLVKPSAFVEELRGTGVAVETYGLTRLIPTLVRLKPHILHAHMFHANTAARLVRLVCPVPVVISTVHSLAETSRHSPNIASRDLAYRLTGWLADATVCVSTAVAERHSAAGAVSRPQVIPNGIDTNRFRPDAGLRAQTRHDLGITNEFVWLAAGRLMWKKNYPLLLDAMSRLHSGMLLIAGEGPDEANLRALAGQLGIAPRFLGPRDDMPALMNAADGFVMSSVVEGLPMVLLEAGACGLPAVATAVGGVPEVVLHDRTGYTVQTDPAALSTAMARLMSLAPAARQQMAQAAREHAVAKFSLSVVASRWEDLYRTLLARARQREMEP